MQTNKDQSQELDQVKRISAKKAALEYEQDELSSDQVKKNTRIALDLERLPPTLRFEYTDDASQKSAASNTSIPISKSDFDGKASQEGAASNTACDPFRYAQLTLLDQTKLPGQTSFITSSNWHEVIDAIAELKVRGAPAIGIAGAAALALAACDLALLAIKDSQADKLQAADDNSGKNRLLEEAASRFDGACISSLNEYLDCLKTAAKRIEAVRPTAVNLKWALKRAMDTAEELCKKTEQATQTQTQTQAQAQAQVQSQTQSQTQALTQSQTRNSRKTLQQLTLEVRDSLFSLVNLLLEEDETCCRSIGAAGAKLLKPASRVLTHCNAGSLATAFYGTALGVIYSAAQEGKIAQVYADETRPVGQGARLTTWELSQAGVPVTLICDNMAASLMAKDEIDAVIVGADRIAANGDTANKIGTYGVAVLANYHHIPFYVAAPLSTIDPHCATGEDIPIEQRAAEEVLPQAIEGVQVYNPAFDVTPAKLISAIITEKGIYAPQNICEAI